MQSSSLHFLRIAAQCSRSGSSSRGISTLAPGYRQQKIPLQWPRQFNCCLWQQRRRFHASSRWRAVKPFILADIGEGIKEVQIIQWFVQPGARVEQFDKLCEVASDKAITEITSRFDGVIKKLHYEPEAMAQVGKPLCDIDIQGDIAPSDAALVTPESERKAKDEAEAKSTLNVDSQKSHSQESAPAIGRQAPTKSSEASSLATPAVRGLLKEHNLQISQIKGTGKDGRVLKEDIHNHLAIRDSLQNPSSTSPPPPPTSALSPDTEPKASETTHPLTPIQNAMFKTMARSLSIPHFLYTTEVDLTDLTSLRKRLNKQPSLIPPSFLPQFTPSSSSSIASSAEIPKLTALPFIIKALSLTLHSYPLLNSRLNIPSSSSSSSPTTSTSTSCAEGLPTLTHRPSTMHSIALAIDTPHGLMVPTIPNVNSLSILEIAAKITHLSTLARAGKLSPSDLSGATITVSNIGNIGGTTVAPVIVPGQVCILGVGKGKVVPRFEKVEGREGGEGIEGREGREGKREVVAREVAGFCWSADHRVLDGGYVARAAECLRGYLEGVGMGGWLVGMR